MLVRAIAVGVAVMVLAVPVSAQQRGMVEIGGFVSSTGFDNSLNLNNAVGGGGRIGAFLHPRLSVEFEGSGARASRPLGLSNRSVRIISARLTAVPVTYDRISILLGLGAGHTDTNIGAGADDQSYGFHGLLGAKLALSDAAAVRLDGIQYWVGGNKNRSLHLGLSLYRKPATMSPQQPQ